MTRKGLLKTARISGSQGARISGKVGVRISGTRNLEVGTVRAILRKHRLWAGIQPDVTMLQTHDDVGRRVTEDEERRLIDACANSRSRSLLPAVTIALSTGMRYSEIRLLRWSQIDLKVESSWAAARRRVEPEDRFR